MTTPKDEAAGVSGDGNAETASAGGGQAPADGQQNISQIRDILFGQHMAEYDRRFAEIEDRITSVTDALRTDFTDRLATLEQSIKHELAELSKDLRSDYERRLDSVEQALAGARGDLQASIDAVRAELGTQAAALREEKVSATTLSTLLTQVAAGLDSARQSEAGAKKR